MPFPVSSLYKPVYRPKENIAESTEGLLISFEPKAFAFIDSNTFLHLVFSEPGVIDLLRWSGKFKDSIQWLTSDYFKFVLTNQKAYSHSTDKWKAVAETLIDKFLNELVQIGEMLSKGSLIDPLIRRISLFKKALPNWSIEQIIYNFEQLQEIASRSVSMAIGYTAYSDSELDDLNCGKLKALSHPSLKHFQGEAISEALSLYTLGAALHSLEHACKASPNTLSEYGKARFIGECYKVLDCKLPSHPDHLEILSKGFELIRLILTDLEKGPDQQNFLRNFSLISKTVSILQQELDYVSWRHIGTQNVFENRISINEESYLLASDYHTKALSLIQEATFDFHNYSSPVPASHAGASKIFPPILDKLLEVESFQNSRNKIIIDPSQFVRIRIYSKDFPPPRQILRDAQVIQSIRIGDDALLTVQPEKELSSYIESGKLSFVTVSLSDKLLAFFAISPDQKKLTTSGKSAINKLSMLKKYKRASFAFVELVASDVSSKFRLKPWVRGAWSFVSAAGENLALNSYGSDERVVLVLIARDGIAAEGVYAASGFKKTKQFLKLQFLGNMHKYNIWTKELRAENVSI